MEPRRQLPEPQLPEAAAVVVAAEYLPQVPAQAVQAAAVRVVVVTLAPQIQAAVVVEIQQSTWLAAAQVAPA